MWGGTIFAYDGSDTTTLNLEQKLKIENSELNEYIDYGNNLATLLKNANEKDYDKIIECFCSSNTNPVFENALKIISDPNNKNKILYINSEKINENYILNYNIGNNKLLIITPTNIIIDELSIVEDSNKISNYATTKSKSGISSRTYYGLVGNKLFSIAVKCTFNYNGTKAWYKSGFDYYYTKGTLSVWQVSNWRGWKEASGTSYKAYCSGNFHWGVEYNGNGLVIQDYYCKNTLTCDKKGNISRSATYI